MMVHQNLHSLHMPSTILVEEDEELFQTDLCVRYKNIVLSLLYFYAHKVTTILLPKLSSPFYHSCKSESLVQGAQAFYVNRMSQIKDPKRFWKKYLEGFPLSSAHKNHGRLKYSFPVDEQKMEANNLKELC